MRLLSEEKMARKECQNFPIHPVFNISKKTARKLIPIPSSSVTSTSILSHRGRVQFN